MSVNLEDDTVLRYQQSDLRDPIEKIISTTKTLFGFEVFLKTHRYLVSLQYDFSGNLLRQNQETIEKFDFLNGDQIYSLISHQYNGSNQSIIMDATKIQTQYIDIYNHSKKSYFIGSNCSTQLPVSIKGTGYLVLTCIEDNQQVINLYELSKL